MAYHREFGLDIRIPRIFNTYGPRMPPFDGRVVPNFISQALNDENLTIYGDGSQTRSFCYIDDLIEGIFNISIKNGLDGEIINIGNPDEYKISDFADLIIDKVGSKSEKEFLPLPEDDPKLRCPNIGKAKRLLNWEPKTSLEKGLTKTIDYLRTSE